MHTLLHTVSPTLQQATTNPHLHQGLLDTHGQVWVSLLWGPCSLFLGPGAQGSVCSLQECFLSPVMFWRLYGKVNGDLLQEALCHTQVCCTQSPCPCSSPLLTCTSTGYSQTQFCLSLCGIFGSWCTQAEFRKGRGTRDQIANIRWIIEKAREFQKNIYFCFIDYVKAFDCVDHKKLWKILKEMEYQTT